MSWLIGLGVAVGLVAAWLALLHRRAGPRQVSDDLLDDAEVIVRSTAEYPEPGWGHLGSETRADGLRLRFDADDDPAAEARFLAPTHERASRSSFGQGRTITLGDEFVTEHVHTAGYVFRIRLRGVGAVVGKQVEIKMMVGTNGKPAAGQIENEDDHDPAVGDWIEVELIEILRLR